MKLLTKLTLKCENSAKFIYEESFIGSAPESVSMDKYDEFSEKEIKKLLDIAISEKNNQEITELGDFICQHPNTSKELVMEYISKTTIAPTGKSLEAIISLSFYNKDSLLTNGLVENFGDKYTGDFDFLAKFGQFAPEESVLMFLNNHLNDILTYGLDIMELRGGEIAKKIEERISKKELKSIRDSYGKEVDSVMNKRYNS